MSKVLVEPLPNCVTNLRIEVAPEKVGPVREKVTAEFLSAAKLPGFRPGKVPRGVVEKRFRSEIDGEVQKRLIDETTKAAIKEHGLKVLTVDGVEEVERGEDGSLRFVASLLIEPAFELPEYRGIPVKVPVSEVSEEDVDRMIEDLRERHAEFDEIAGRGAEMGDFAVIDYVGEAGGEPVDTVYPEAGKPLARGEDFWIRMTDESFLPGFCGALVGMAAGEERSFEVEVPGDFPVEAMRGTKLGYRVTLRGLKAKRLPEVDDAFAAQVSGRSTLAELRELVADQMRETRAAHIERYKRDQVMSFLLSKVECELPQRYVRSETQRLLDELVEENQQRGVSEDVLRENEKDLIGAAARGARERVKGMFILGKIAEAERLKVTREELMGRVASLAQRWGMSFEKALKEIDRRGVLGALHEEILTGKALDFLASGASVETVQQSES
jgi:trigger factor